MDTLFDASFRMIAPTHFFDTEWAGSAHGLTKGGAHGARARARAPAGAAADPARPSPRLSAHHRGRGGYGPAAGGGLAHGVKGPATTSATSPTTSCAGWRGRAGSSASGSGARKGRARCAATTRPAVARAIRYAVQIAGIDHVALGSDWDGTVSRPLSTPRASSADGRAARGRASPTRTWRKVMGGNAVRLLSAQLP